MRRAVRGGEVGRVTTSQQLTLWEQADPDRERELRIRALAERWGVPFEEALDIVVDAGLKAAEAEP